MKTVLALVAVLLLAGAAGAQDWCWDADRVTAAYADGRLTVHHLAALYNCCPDPYEYDIHLDGDRLVIVEHEVLEAPCDCMCCFNVGLHLWGVPAGVASVSFSWRDYEQNGWLTRVVPVSVPDGPAADGLSSQTFATGCLDTTGVPEEPAPSAWGAVKSLYR